MPEFSVVIPTYNRMDVLPEVVAALENQEGAPDFELIIIDDGSQDGTAQWLQQTSWRIAVQTESQPNQGPAAARNRGVALAHGRLVAFLGDDTVPDKGWLAAHHRAHRTREGPLAVIGYTRWHSRLRLNPFLRYINEYGLQFGYALIQDRENVPFNFFYTSNVSLQRALLRAEPFDLRFPYAAWEDIELSYRLTQKHGMRLVYAPEAQVAHDHPTTLERFMVRQEKAGYCAVVFYLLHPELGGFLGLSSAGPPPLLGKTARLRELVACGLQHLPISTPRLWEEVLRGQYIRGLNRAWHEQARLGIGGVT